jgi:ankyrin repeat protein
LFIVKTNNLISTENIESKMTGISSFESVFSPYLDFSIDTYHDLARSGGYVDDAIAVVVKVFAKEYNKVMQIAEQFAHQSYLQDLAIARARALNAVEQLIVAGANVNALYCDDDGDFLQPALHFAADANLDDFCKLLIDVGKCNVNAKDFSESTALFGACFYGSAACVDILLAAGADMDAKNCDGRTALYAAVFNDSNNRVDIVQRLVVAGASDTEERCTIFHLSEENPDMMRWLLMIPLADQRINQVDAYDRTASEHALIMEHDQNFQLLFAAGSKSRFRWFRDLDENGKHLENPPWIARRRAEIENTRRQFQKLRFTQIVRPRALTIAVALQQLRLPALVTLTILDAACDDTMQIPMHVKWNVVIAVKHYKKL